jgi:hypothetical protein
MAGTWSMHSRITTCIWKPVQESVGGTDRCYTNQTKITLDMCSVAGFCDDGDEHLDSGILKWQCVNCYEITIHCGKICGRTAKISKFNIPHELWTYGHTFTSASVITLMGVTSRSFGGICCLALQGTSMSIQRTGITGSSKTIVRL